MYKSWKFWAVLVAAVVLVFFVTLYVGRKSGLDVKVFGSSVIPDASATPNPALAPAPAALRVAA